MTLLSFVIPAKAGIHHQPSQGRTVTRWIPAFAGMTNAFVSNVGISNGVHHG
jgi:hypothetical protein